MENAGFKAEYIFMDGHILNPQDFDVALSGVGDFLHLTPANHIFCNLLVISIAFSPELRYFYS